MAESPQIQDMDAKHVAERHLVEKYLAGELSEADAEAFESLVASHPELAMQVEYVARMKTGLDVLRRRGELVRLLQERPKAWHRSRWVAVSVAAAASVVLVVFLTLRLATPQASMIASTLEGLADSKGSTPRIVAAYLLTAERAAAPAAQINVLKGDGEAVELRFDAAAGTDDLFTVDVLRAEGDSLRSIALATKIPGSADGSVVVYVSARALDTGNYLFRLTPDNGEIPLEFSARVGGS